ncbi:hypothetical protein GCM10027612_28350 [Microbispora bryophytorum subsp. camponoti]
MRAEVDEDRRVVVIERGALRIAANFAEGPVSVRLAASRILLASDESARLSGEVLDLPGRSLTIAEV